MNEHVRHQGKDLIRAALAEAEEVRLPLEDLVEATKTDPGAPFAPEAIEALAILKAENRPAFEALRARLKAQGCRVGAGPGAGPAGWREGRQAGAHPGRSPDPTRRHGRALPHGRWHPLRRPHGGRTPGDLAPAEQRIPPLACPTLLRGDAGGTERRSHEWSPGRSRGQGLLRRAGTAGVRPCG